MLLAEVLEELADARHVHLEHGFGNGRRAQGGDHVRLAVAAAVGEPREHLGFLLSRGRDVQLVGEKLRVLAEIDAVAAVVNELVAQRQTRRKHLEARHKAGESEPGKQGAGPDTQ